MWVWDDRSNDRHEDLLVATVTTPATDSGDAVDEALTMVSQAFRRRQRLLWRRQRAMSRAVNHRARTPLAETKISTEDPAPELTLPDTSQLPKYLED